MTTIAWSPARRPAGPDRERLAVALVSVHGDPLAALGADGAGGQNVYVREVARSLVRRGHRVDVYTRARMGALPEVVDLDGARVVRLPCGPEGYVGRDDLYPHLPAFVAAVEAFRAVDRPPVDLFHSNYWLSGFVGMRLAAAWRVEQVHTHHSLGAVKFAATHEVPAMGQVRLAIEDALSERCQAIVATSPEDLASLDRHYTNRAAAVIVPCGVDPGVFRPGDRARARAALGLAAGDAVVAYAGRFDPNKGIETLVRAVARLGGDRPVKLLLAGGFEPDGPDGAEYRRIEALVAELGLAARTTFLGACPPFSLASAYRAADVVAVPSRYESFGLVAIEAMACGTPVVASDVGGLSHTVVHRPDAAEAPATLVALGRALHAHRVRARLVYSGARDLDVVPWRAGKGRARAYLAAAMGIPLGRVVACGDPGNDLDMIRLGGGAVIVGNAGPELALAAPSGAVRAARPYAGGVLEGLRALGVLS